ncbi:MAG: Nif3-like dinuclear metal center hexameric protein [Congregibacter sp.]
MAVALSTLVSHCSKELNSDSFDDYCPNGLQVQGKGRVQKLAAAVTANQSVLDEAVDWGADALLVHHGYFWRGEAQPIVAMKRRRLGTLLGADMSLLAYHLPLDAHPVLGNNARFGSLLGIQSPAPLAPGDARAVGNIGTLPAPVTLATLSESVHALTSRVPQLIGSESRVVSRIAWCTGAAQGYLEQAAACGADVYISGEISEPTVHASRELDIAYLAAGHHATERYGVQALAAALAGEFDLEWTFIDCDNPV